MVKCMHNMVKLRLLIFTTQLWHRKAKERNEFFEINTRPRINFAVKRLRRSISKLGKTCCSSLMTTLDCVHRWSNQSHASFACNSLLAVYCIAIFKYCGTPWKCHIDYIISAAAKAESNISWKSIIYYTFFMHYRIRGIWNLCKIDFYPLNMRIYTDIS